MLGLQERKSKLEDLLHRIRRNREQFEERQPIAAQRSAPMPARAFAEEIPIDLTQPVAAEGLASSIARAQLLSEELPQTAKAEAVDKEPGLLIDKEAAAVADEVEEDFEKEFAAAEEEVVEINVEQDIQSLKEQSVEILGSEAPDDEESAEVLEAGDTGIIGEPAEVDAGSEAVVASEGEFAPREFVSTPRATGAVGVFRGEQINEWTLEAVLERAWKLGSNE